MVLHAPHLQQVAKAMYTVVYAKVQINDDTHGEVMSPINVKQGCPQLSPTLSSLYIDKLEACLDEIDKDYPCLFHIVVAIFIYVEDIILLSKSRASLQRLLNKLYEFCTSSSLEVNPTTVKIMIFDRNQRKSNQEAFYPSKDQIKITHEYKYLEIDDFYPHENLKLSSERGRITNPK